MSEALFNGPLDVARRFTSYAVKLDELATTCPDPDGDSYIALQNKLFDFNADNPLLYQAVEIRGTVLTSSLGEDGTQNLLSLPPAISAILKPAEEPNKEPTMSIWLPSPHEDSSVEGEYWGLDLRRVYDPQLDQTATRIVHVIKTGTSQNWDEQQVNLVTTEHCTYVGVEDSDIQVTAPILAHSHQDLSSYLVYEQCEDILTSDLQPRQLIRNIGKLANKFLAQEDIEPTIHNQFVSWLNATQLMEGIQLRAPDVAIATRENFSSGHDVEYRETVHGTVVTSPLLDYGPGYYKLPEGMAATTDTLELYATVLVDIDSDKIVFMPLGNVVDIELVDAA
ncbi:MAG: hypothetical protein JWL89_115 [Candidatus Saccharibacteria bacterium]|nr:hypothetical protein [Candidatus Saccharibacteria bacterium]